MQHTYGFLGFYYTHCMQPGEQLSLAVFRDRFSPAFLRYISFLKARGRCGDYLSKNCHSAVRVIHYLKASSAQLYTPLQQQQFKEQDDMLDILKWQLRKISRHRPFNYDALMEGANWKGVPELLAFIEQEKQKACDVVKVRKSRARHASIGAAAMSVRCAVRAEYGRVPP